MPRSIETRAPLDAVPAAQEGVPSKWSGDSVSWDTEISFAVDSSDPHRIAFMSNGPILRVSSDSGYSWSTRGLPFLASLVNGGTDPWMTAGNAPGESFATLLRFSSAPGISEVVISKSQDYGDSWSTFYVESGNPVAQDREMVAVDRSTARGGGPGSIYDGRVYLTYDAFKDDLYQSSYLILISPSGEQERWLKISDPDHFVGRRFQPVAGVVDGLAHLLGGSENGSEETLVFQSVDGNFNMSHSVKDSIKYQRAGQKLGNSNRYGLNGHRVHEGGVMDIDRSDGARRGTLYVVSARNPNPRRTDQDQGDIYLSRAGPQQKQWTSLVIPGQTPGKSQFFQMMDVDDNGWVHVAYYQNETGVQDGGVLNAALANVYYTFSTDGGDTWSEPIQVNDDGDGVTYKEPPPDRKDNAYYLIGDYQQVQAVGQGDSTVVHVCWSSYDAEADLESSHCATIRPFGSPAPTPTPDSRTPPLRYRGFVDTESSSRIALSPAPENAYLFAFVPSGKAVSAYRRDPHTGALTLADRTILVTQGSASPDGRNVLQVSADGRTLYVTSPYVTNRGAPVITTLGWDPSLGRFLTQAPFPLSSQTDNGVQGLALSPDGYAYATLSGSKEIIILRVDSHNGTLSLADSYSDEIDPLYASNALIMNPDGGELYRVGFASGRSDIGTIAVYERDRATGGLRRHALYTRGTSPALPDFDSPWAATVSTDGQLLMVTTYEDRILIFERLPGGELRLASNLQDGMRQADLLDELRRASFSTNGKRVYTTSYLYGALSVFAVDPDSRQLTWLGSFRDERGETNRLAGANQVLESGDGRFVYVNALLDDAISIFEVLKTGPCEGEGPVAITDLITMVNIALGTTTASLCPAGDTDGSGDITINELIEAVQVAVDQSDGP